MSRECIKSPSPWFWMSRKFLLEMGGGVKQPRVRTQRGGVRMKRTCAYEGGGGSNFSHFGAYVLIE